MQYLKISIRTNSKNSCKEPWKWAESSLTRCVYWPSTNRVQTPVDDREYRGDLIEQFDLIISFLQRNLRLRRVIKAEGQNDEWEIPFVALREAVANALVHREYINTTEGVRVEVFSDRIEISSPGDLPQG